MPSLIWFFCAFVGLFAAPVFGDIEYNTINADGSFRFRHANDDIGGYYHSASGTPDKIVRGRYGSRSPASGKIEETVYTAGPRGFRVNGPKIHRKMDLAQYPVLPRGSPDDPLADPYDDPSYSFSFRTADQSRSEENDATNRVRGLYSYLDDVGERHSVRYAAGAGTGFEVSNAVPDNPASVGYSNPLYKAHPKTRGKMSVQRGPGGSYKLIAAGPDHRRAESRGSDGLVRGTYSFLDDKGVQRTVEYIAGAGIGYRVLHNHVGPGTHINPSVADFRLTDTDFRLANDFGRGAGGGLGGASADSRGGGGGGGGGIRDRGSAGSGAGSASRTGSTDSTDYLKEDEAEVESGSSDVDNIIGDGGGSAGGSGGGSANGGSSGIRGTSTRGKENRIGLAAGSSERGNTKYDGAGSADGRRTGGGNRRGGGDRNSSGSTSSSGSNRNNANSSRDRNRYGGAGSNTGKRRGGTGAGSAEKGFDYSYLPPTGSTGSGPGDNYNLNDEEVGGSLPPLVTANHHILSIDRNREWVNRHRDSTIIKNVGKWYLGLPPGFSVRAHVQNIDLVPLGGREGSPSEALRQDELAELAASI